MAQIEAREAELREIGFPNWSLGTRLSRVSRGRMTAVKRKLALCVIAAVCLAFSANIRGANDAATSPGTPQLPETLYNYANVDFPAHFRIRQRRFGSVLDADNTPPDNPITDAGATLGRVLFYDKRLSANDTVSCGSCHQQQHGFSDPSRLSKGLHGKSTARRSMGLTNARFYRSGRFFWDERAATLEEQVLMPIQDKVEMGMSLDDLEPKLAAVDFYPPLFEAAFGTPEVNRDRISRALAQFVRSLVSYESKYDQAFSKGSSGRPAFEQVFNQQELLGLRLFSGGLRGRSARCDRCHGTVGQFSRSAQNNGLDLSTEKDAGAGRGRFKAPSLRNVAARAPYMHDGRFKSLRDVVEHYNSGVANHPDLDRALRARFFYEVPQGIPFGPENFGQNFGPERLNLNNVELNAIVAFLETLTDRKFLNDPRFSDPFADPNDRRLAQRGKRARKRKTRSAEELAQKAENREKIAQRKLEFAKAAEKPSIRKAKLQMLVKRFEETKAAQQAKLLLGQQGEAKQNQ